MPCRAETERGAPRLRETSSTHYVSHRMPAWRPHVPLSCLGMRCDSGWTGEILLPSVRCTLPHGCAAGSGVALRDDVHHSEQSPTLRTRYDLPLCPRVRMRSDGASGRRATPATLCWLGGTRWERRHTPLSCLRHGHDASADSGHATRESGCHLMHRVGDRCLHGASRRSKRGWLLLGQDTLIMQCSRSHGT